MASMALSEFIISPHVGSHVSVETSKPGPYCNSSLMETNRNVLKQQSRAKWSTRTTEPDALLVLLSEHFDHSLILTRDSQHDQLLKRIN